jgi:hypothetical protein
MAKTEITVDPAPLSPLLQRAIEIDVAQAFLAVMEDRLSAAVANDVFQAVVDELASSAAHKVRERYPSPGLANLWEVWQSLGGDDRLALHLDELTGSRLRFHVDHCQYADLYQSRGQEEIGIAFSCRRDEPFANALVPGVTVVQSKTILEGSARCEFTFTMEEE